MTRTAIQALLIATVLLTLLALSGCKRPEVLAADAAANPSGKIYFYYRDAGTGCEYVGNSAGPTASRIAGDGKTHMGCRQAVQP